MIRRIYRYFFPKITYHWTVWDGFGEWQADLIRHANGQPCLPPEALHYVECDSKGTAIALKNKLTRVEREYPFLRCMRGQAKLDFFFEHLA